MPKYGDFITLVLVQFAVSNQVILIYSPSVEWINLSLANKGLSYVKEDIRKVQLRLKAYIYIYQQDLFSVLLTMQ